MIISASRYLLTDCNVLFVQEYFMDLYLLAELKTISLKITTVDMKGPPADFRSNFEVRISLSFRIFIYV